MMSWQQLCKNVDYLIFGEEKVDFDLLEVDLFTHEVVVNFNILCTCMEDRIVNQVNSSNVVAPWKHSIYDTDA